jgi:hypothetical protein
VTVDRDLIQAGSSAVAAGRAESLSGWVNLAMAERAAKERRLQAMAEAVATYELRFGPISQAELLTQARTDASSATVVRGRRKSAPRYGRRRSSETRTR